MPFDPEGAHVGPQPALQGFHVPISSDRRAHGCAGHLYHRPRTLRLQVRGADGQFLPTSERQVRIVTANRSGATALLLAAVPLLVMLFVIVRRSRRVSS